MSVTSMFLRPVVGNLADHVSKYRLTFIGGILCSIGNIGYCQEQGIANSTVYLRLDIGMALGPMLGGLISDLLSIRWYYPTMLILLPILALIFVMNRRRLDSAIS